LETIEKKSVKALAETGRRENNRTSIKLTSTNGRRASVKRGSSSKLTVF